MKIGDKVKINWEKYKKWHEFYYLAERFQNEKLQPDFVVKISEGKTYNEKFVQLDVGGKFRWNIKPEYLIPAIPKTHNHPLTKMFL